MENLFTQAKIRSGLFIFLFPFIVGCSVFGGTNYSSNPVVATQQRHIEDLKAEVRNAERNTEEAELREKAAKNRLKAAEAELKVIESELKRRNNL